MRGRKPTPTSLKILRGNPGKRRLSKHEPRPAVSIPRCPEHLSTDAKTEWRRISRELAGLGLLSTIDRAALAVYCQAWARWKEAELNIARHGLVVKTPGTGVPMQNPFLPVANKAIEQMRSFLSEFGMTPASRTRIEVNPVSPQAGSDDDAWDRLKLGIA